MKKALAEAFLFFGVGMAFGAMQKRGALSVLPPGERQDPGQVLQVLIGVRPNSSQRAAKRPGSRNRRRGRSGSGIEPPVAAVRGMTQAHLGQQPGESCAPRRPACGTRDARLMAKWVATVSSR